MKSEELKKLIEDNRLEEAANQLVIYTRNFDKKYATEAILHASAYKKLQQNERMGILSVESIRQERSRITIAILELIDLVENTPEILSKKKEQRGRTFKERELNNNDDSKDKKEDTYYDQTIKKFKNKKLIAWIIIIFVILAGIATVLKSCTGIMDFFKNKSNTPSKIETSK